MVTDKIVIKGNKEGLNVVINMNHFSDFDDMLDSLVKKLSQGKKFYKGSTLKITTELKYINEKESIKLKEILFDEFLISDCIFQDQDESTVRLFTGIYEGKTKFLRKTIRSGQSINYPGNIVIVGDVNPGAEIYAAGNIIVLGNLRGVVHAGTTGNEKAIIAALKLEPQILQIGSIVTRSPEDNLRPQYPEVAKIKNGNIIVEPYLENKYI
ncbi:septum site-determining protein MinC [Clostridium sp. FP2]|uniref:septum site-determining protein MinC n=1 Tax=Clostridium TaxID=1485 RepID=UPI0013E8FCBF|nr:MULTISPECIES: septum site-determining protein MinC [Clostridium]MBW9155096.1 septum site-determining protein MinC [Clostridium tagluense]MBZ9624708.1 septum site-determining protein MinC [Clostridium sp. FP2]WLC67991.1 septum site-determining protein MinC [Clostridium tagluense]